MSRLLIVMAMLTACGDGPSFGDDLPPPVIANPPPLDADTRRDIIVQVTEPEVDVLWMIDNSCSMSDDQTALREAFPSFMNFFLGSGLDYHIGVTTSTLNRGGDGNDGRLVKHNGTGDLWIDKSTPNPVGRFEDIADVGTNGGNEEGIGAVYKCLEERIDTDNDGFYREDAGLTTVAISDEPDYTSNSLISPNEFEDWYSGLKKDPDLRTFSSIVTPRGSKYSDATEYIGGIDWDLEEDDNWEAVLELLGLQAAGFKREFFLAQLPVPGTIEVAVITPGGAVIQGVEFSEENENTAFEWEYNEGRNSISFLEFYPEALSKVQIDYTLLSSQSDNDESATAGTEAEGTTTGL